MVSNFEVVLCVGFFVGSVLQLALVPTRWLALTLRPKIVLKLAKVAFQDLPFPLFQLQI